MRRAAFGGWLFALALAAGAAGAGVREEGASGRLIPLEPGGRALALSGDRVAAARGPAISLVELRTGNSLGSLQGHTAPIQALQFSPDGKLLASAGAVETILWDAAAGKLLTRVPFPAAAPERSRVTVRYFLAFSPDGSWLAIGSGAHGVRLWDVKRGAAGPVVAPSVGLPSAAAFSPDGKRLAIGTGTGGFHGAVAEYDALSGRPRQHGAYRYALYSDVLSVAFSATGDQVLSGHLHGWLGWSDTTEPDARSDFKSDLVPVKPPATVRDFLISPRGERVAVLTDRLQVWDRQTWRRLLDAPGVRGPAAFSTDGRTLAAFQEAGGLRLWSFD